MFVLGNPFTIFILNFPSCFFNVYYKACQTDKKSSITSYKWIGESSNKLHCFTNSAKPSLLSVISCIDATMVDKPSFSVESNAATP